MQRRGNVTVLTGSDGGAYPQGNSVLVSGLDETVLIDPSLSLVARGGAGAVDRIVLSHVHEDHVAGVSCYPDTPVWVHRRDRRAITSLEEMVAIYGFEGGAAVDFGRDLTEQFAFRARPDAHAFDDHTVFDVGGSRIEVVPTPGHTPGHCCLLVEPESVLYLGDIDLSGFGPYYADVDSSLADFEASIERCRRIEAEWYVTFHHKGTITDRADFLAALDRFAAAIERRDARLLELLGTPRTLDELVAARILYREHVDHAWVDHAERFTISRHLDRLHERGLVAPHGGRWSLAG